MRVIFPNIVSLYLSTHSLFMLGFARTSLAAPFVNTNYQDRVQNRFEPIQELLTTYGYVFIIDELCYLIGCPTSVCFRRL